MSQRISNYELVGHRFLSRGDSMSLLHHFTFSISLRLASGSKWIAYYHWVEGGFSHQPKNLSNMKSVPVASGRGVQPVSYRRAEVWPKDVIKGEPNTILRYIRYQGASAVLLRLNAHGVFPPLDFRMTELTPSSTQEDFTYNGITALWGEQVLGSSVWGKAPLEEWRLL
jgi:hypothetical protein